MATRNPHVAQATCGPGLKPLRVALALALQLGALTASPALAAPGPEVGAAVYVSGRGVRLRAGPSASTDVLAELEQGRWLAVDEVGDSATFDTHAAPWIRVSDPFAPLAASPFVGASAGWVWGGLVQTVPDATSPPSLANWERLILRVDPATGLVSPASERGEAVAWALHVNPGSESQPRTLEVGEWLRLGTTASRTWTALGWRSVSLLTTVEPGDGGAWLLIHGVAADGSDRIELRPSMLPGAGLVLDVRSTTQTGRGQVDLLWEDVDGDGVTELITLEHREDARGATVGLTLQSYTLRAGVVGALAEAVNHEPLLPAPNLRLEAPTIHRVSGRASATFNVVCDGAARPAGTLVVRATALSGWSGGPRRTLGESVQRLAVPAMLPDQQVSITADVPLALHDAAQLIVQGVVLPQGPEAKLLDNLARTTTPWPP